MPKKMLLILLVLNACSLGSNLIVGNDASSNPPSQPPATEPETPENTWDTSTFFDKIKGKYVVTRSTPPVLWATVEDDGTLHLNALKVRRYMHTQKSPSKSTYASARRPEYTHWFGVSLEIDGTYTNFIWLSAAGSLDSWSEESYVDFDYKNIYAGINYNIYRISDTKP